MLLRDDARSKACRRVAIADRHRRLGNDRPGVNVGDDKMRRATVHPHAIVQRPLVGVQALICWQQSRMDIDHAAVPGANEALTEDPHEPSKTNEFDAMEREHHLHRPLEIGALTVNGVVDHGCRNVALAGKHKALRRRSVGKDQDNCGRIVWTLRRADECPHV